MELVAEVAAEPATGVQVQLDKQVQAQLVKDLLEQTVLSVLLMPAAAAAVQEEVL
jgi:hypothetical protein